MRPFARHGALLALRRTRIYGHMVKRRTGTARVIAAFRMLPLLAWLAIQLSMTAMPVQAYAEPHDPKITALFETLGVDSLVLCTPDGKQVFEKHEDHASHEECGWCQGFASTIVPEPAGVCVPLVLTGVDPGFCRNVSSFADTRLLVCHPSRAPPVPI